MWSGRKYTPTSGSTGTVVEADAITIPEGVTLRESDRDPRERVGTVSEMDEVTENEIESDEAVTVPVSERESDRDPRERVVDPEKDSEPDAEELGEPVPEAVGSSMREAELLLLLESCAVREIVSDVRRSQYVPS